MQTWKSLYDKLQTVDVDFEAAEGFNDASKEYERLNTEQMFLGKRSDGSEIEPPYTPTTVGIKKRKGQPFDRVTLKDTGLFYKNLDAFADNDKIYIDSDTPYTDKLVEKYGTKIFGLDVDNRKDFVRGAYWSVIKRRFQTATGLNFK